MRNNTGGKESSFSHLEFLGQISSEIDSPTGHAKSGNDLWVRLDALELGFPKDRLETPVFFSIVLYGE